MTALLDGLFHFDLLNLAFAVAETFAVAVGVIRSGCLAGADIHLCALLDLCCCAATKQCEGSDKGDCVFHKFRYFAPFLRLQSLHSI